jgi:NADPH:quinone reductase-like Zn-dependent oxidoreductase
MTDARIIRFHETGGPEVLKIETVDVPSPGQGEVRIKAHALGLNRAESMFRSGAYVVEPDYPAKIGYEVAGTVEAVGTAVENVAIGDAVSLLPLSALTDYAVHGELVIAPARFVVKHPANLTFEEAAAAWMQYLTAYGALVEQAKVGPGDAVIIPAASSSVGLAAIQIAKRAGAVPIALTRGSSKVQKLRDAGAFDVIVTEKEDLVARIREITGGLGARITFDPVGGDTFALLADAAAPDGILFIYGALAEGITPLPILPVLSKHLTVRGYDVFELAEKPMRFALALDDINRGLADGTLKPIIDRVFPFESCVFAQPDLVSNQQFGKIVVAL